MTPPTQRRSSPVARPLADRPPAPGRQATIEALLGETGRGIVPVRKTFVQTGHGPTTAPGPMAAFIRGGDSRGLEAYLFAHAMASSSRPYDVGLDAGTWVRILGIGETQDGTIDPDAPSALSAVSKVFKRIEDRKLITRSRIGRKSRITLLREIGNGRPYRRPMGRRRGDRWLQLPHAYWTDGHYRALSLPGKACLLVALTLQDGFQLPERCGPEWYGISPETVGDGLRELIKKELLNREFDWVRADRAAHGWTQVHHYTLLGPYSAAARAVAARGRADDEIDVDDQTEAGLHLIVNDDADAQPA